MTDLPTIEQRRFMRALDERDQTNLAFNSWRAPAASWISGEKKQDMRRRGWIAYDRLASRGIWALTDEGKRILDKLATCA